jgi:LmbE family N-acetylglucosaminyl deacetylase
MHHKEYRKQRVAEAQASAKLFGARDCIILDHMDGHLQVDQPTILQLCDLIRDLKPDMIVGHWRGSFHRDHRNAYELMMEASFLAALPAVERSLPAHCIKGMYYLENWEDLEEYQPDLWVDVSDALPKWKEACEQHQLLRGEISFNYLHYYVGLAAKRGAEVGVKYAITVSLPPISRKRKVDWLPVDTEPVLVF